MKTITIRVYSNSDRDVLEREFKAMGIGPERFSFDAIHEDYVYNEVFLKATDEEFDTLKFRLQLSKPDVYEI